MNLLLGKFNNINNSDLCSIINCYQDYFTFKTQNNDTLLYLDIKVLKYYLKNGFNIKYRNYIFASLKNNHEFNKQNNSYKLLDKYNYISINNKCILPNTEFLNINLKNLEHLINISNNIISNKNNVKIRDKNIIKLSNNFYVNTILERFYYSKIDDLKFKFNGIILNYNDSDLNKILSLITINYNKKKNKVENKTLKFSTKCTLIITDINNIEIWENIFKKYISESKICVIKTKNNLKKIFNKDIFNLDFLIININIVSNKYYKKYYEKYYSLNNLDISITNSIHEKMHNKNIENEELINLYIFNWNNIIYDNIKKISFLDKYNFIFHLSTLNVKYYLSESFLENNTLDYIIKNSIYDINNYNNLVNLDNFYNFINKELIFRDDNENINIKHEFIELTLTENEQNIYDKLFNDTEHDEVYKSLFFLEYYKYNFIKSYNENNNVMYYNNKCPICLDIIEKNNTCIVNCGHHFCKDCLRKFINKNDKNNKYVCPLCRDNININEIRILCDHDDLDDLSNLCKNESEKNGTKINKLIEIIKNEKYYNVIIISQFNKNILNDDKCDLSDKSIIICNYNDFIKYIFSKKYTVIFLDYLCEENILLEVNIKLKENLSNINKLYFMYIKNTFEKNIIDKIYKYE